MPMMETLERLGGLGLVPSLMANLLPDWQSGRSKQFNMIFTR